MNNKKQQVDTPQKGSWASTINKTPIPQKEPSQNVRIKTISQAEYNALAPVLSGR